MEKKNKRNLILYNYIFGIRVKGVPHRSDNFGHFAERSVGILTFNGRLGVTEEESVR